MRKTIAALVLAASVLVPAAVSSPASATRVASCINEWEWWKVQHYHFGMGKVMSRDRVENVVSASGERFSRGDTPWRDAYSYRLCEHREFRAILKFNKRTRDVKAFIYYVPESRF